jgi:hypothetical protein
MDLRNLSVTSLFPSKSMYYDVDNIKELKEGSFEAEPRKLVWIKEKPSSIVAMDTHLRKTFEIPDDGMMVFTLYQPPEKGDTNVVIKKPKQRLFSRVLFTTITESPQVSIMNRKNETMKMKSGEAYSVPHPVNNMVEFEFDNKRTLIIPARKGFRQQRMTKKVENRYILMFDYIYADDIKKAVSDISGKDENVEGY